VKALLLSAYAAASHVHWRAQLLTQCPDWAWTVLELPPRHFSWRVRGNPLYWSLEEQQTLQRPYDVLVATSMVDLATLRGLVPSLCRCPSLLYFHENQFQYPAGRARHGLLEAQMVNLYSALAADRLGFNSAWNRDSFLAGVDHLLGRLPDRVPPGVTQRLSAKSTVLPVPVDTPVAGAGLPWGESPRYPAGPLRLLWNARFEHDKGGGRLLALLRLLETTGLDWQLAVVGQQFRDAPPAFAELGERYRERLVHFGFLPRRDALAAMQRGADIVISTALHEFQGLSVAEAVMAGCLPLVPDRLAYRELYPAPFRYASHECDEQAEARAAVKALLKLAEGLAQGAIQPPSLEGLQARALGPAYRKLLAQLAASG
jgi:glycosyltransferase involved in cell wall biosynthesis